MHNLPSFRTYGNYKSDNHGSHALVFSMKGTEVYFSYQTPVAFYHGEHGLVVRENDWGPTTGKHLNWIDGGSKEAKAKRVNGNDFEKLLREVVG